MMASRNGSEQELLEAETRRLEARGYTIYRGRNDLIPKSLAMFAPDAIAIGRDPKYLIEVVREDPDTLEKVKALQRQIAGLPGWELLVVLDRGSRVPELRLATIEQIEEAIRSVRNVVETGEAAPALLLAWGTFEALSRKLVPDEFVRPQSPGRLIQILASQGYLTSDEEKLLRKLAKTRNAIIHGELSESAQLAEVKDFIRLIDGLRRHLI